MKAAINQVGNKAPYIEYNTTIKTFLFSNKAELLAIIIVLLIISKNT